MPLLARRGGAGGRGIQSPLSIVSSSMETRNNVDLGLRAAGQPGPEPLRVTKEKGTGKGSEKHLRVLCVSRSVGDSCGVHAWSERVSGTSAERSASNARACPLRTGWAAKHRIKMIFFRESPPENVWIVSCCVLFGLLRLYGHLCAFLVGSVRRSSLSGMRCWDPHFTRYDTYPLNVILILLSKQMH